MNGGHHPQGTNGCMMEINMYQHCSAGAFCLDSNGLVIGSNYIALSGKHIALE